MKSGLDDGWLDVIDIQSARRGKYISGVSDDRLTSTAFVHHLLWLKASHVSPNIFYYE